MSIIAILSNNSLRCLCKDIKKCFQFVLMLFFLGIAYGYFFQRTTFGAYEFGNYALRSSIVHASVASAIQHRIHHGVSDFLLIYSSNIGVCFVIMLTGILFGIVPVVCAAYFGSLVGCQLRTQTFPVILIHGLFEMIGLLLSCAVGVFIFQFASRSIRNMIHKVDLDYSLKELSRNTLCCVFYINLIIIFAAIMEAFISSFLAEILYCQL